MLLTVNPIAGEYYNIGGNFTCSVEDMLNHLLSLSNMKNITIEIDKEKMRTVYIDQAAYLPKNPIAPNRKLIFSLAILVGLFSGILLTFIIESIQNQRKTHSK